MHRALAEASDHLLSLLPPAAPSGLISVIVSAIATSLNTQALLDVIR